MKGKGKIPAFQAALVPAGYGAVSEANEGQGDGEFETQVAENVEVLKSYDDEALLDTLISVLEDRPGVVQELVDWAIPDRAYVSARAVLENRLTGVIKSYNEEKGYGFIDCPEVKEAFGHDAFLHRGQIGEHTVGSMVSFAILLSTEHKPQAFDLGPAPGGARWKNQDTPLWEKGNGKNGKPGGIDAERAPLRPYSPPTWWPAQKGSDGCGGPMAPLWSPGAWGPGAWGPGAWNPAMWLEGCKGKGYPASAGSGCGKGKGSTRLDEPSWGQSNAIDFSDRRFIGSIKSFNDKNRFGFISCPELSDHFGNDVFLHHRQKGNMEVGQEVSFTVFLNKNNKPQAADVEPADQGASNAEAEGEDEAAAGTGEEVPSAGMKRSAEQAGWFAGAASWKRPRRPGPI